MARVKVRIRTPTQAHRPNRVQEEPQPIHPPPPPPSVDRDRRLPWGQNSVLVQRDEPPPICLEPTCARIAVRLTSDGVRTRYSRWCYLHRPFADGHCLADVRAAAHAPHAPHADPADRHAPRCLIPGCDRVREVRFRPFNLETEEYEAPVRHPVCAMHRRRYGRVWRQYVPPDILEQHRMEEASNIARERKAREAYRASVLAAKAQIEADHPDTHRLVKEWNPEAFFTSLPRIERDDITRRAYFSRQYPTMRDKTIAYYTQRWDRYKATGIETFAPTPDQWRDVLDYMDTVSTWQPGDRPDEDEE